MGTGVVQFVGLVEMVVDTHERRRLAAADQVERRACNPLVRVEVEVLGCELFADLRSDAFGVAK